MERGPRSSDRSLHIKRLLVAAKPFTARNHPTARIVARIVQADQTLIINIYHFPQETEPKEARKSRAPTARPRGAKAAASRATSAVRTGLLRTRIAGPPWASAGGAGPAATPTRVVGTGVIVAPPTLVPAPPTPRAMTVPSVPAVRSAPLRAPMP